MSMCFENVCTIEVAAFGQHCESYMGSPNAGFPGLQNSIYTDTFHATWKKPWHWEVMDWTGTTMSRSSHTCAGYREKQCCHLKLAGLGYLTSPGKLNGFSLCFPPIVKAWKSESKHLNSFFCCFSFCLLEVSLPQIFQKEQVSLADSLTQSQLGLFQVFQSLKAMVIMKIILFYWGLLYYSADAFWWRGACTSSVRRVLPLVLNLGVG